RWSCLLNKYLQSQNYFNRTLQGSIKSWARCYQLNCFIVGIQSTQHVENILDNEAKWACHNSYMNSLPTNQAPSIVASVFSKVLEMLKLYVTPHILAVQEQQIAGSLLYRALLRLKEDILELQENQQLDYDNGFLEDHLDRPQTSIITLIKDIEPNDIIEIWELMLARRWYYDEWQDIKLEDFQSVEISMAFQRTATSIIVLDFHIIEQVRDSNIHIVKNQKSAIENVDNENNQIDKSQQMLVADPLVTKHRGRPPIKRLKSSSENLNSHVVDNNAEELCYGSKRKYVCNLCGGTGHNARTCKQQE
ncbi:20788_t:CDS:2, partial [Gigaspora rosea]